jgi:hypothetical protein
LRVPAIRGLVEVGAIQLPLSDQRDLAEITAPDYPGERLVVCRNPLLAEERARKRGERAARQEAVARRGQDCARGRSRHRPLQNGQALHHHHHRWRLDVHAQRAADRGRSHPRCVYVLRTSLEPATLDAAATVKVYK